MIYVDTNVLISAYLVDGNHDAALDWMNSQEDALVISNWVRCEFVGHVGLRLRKDEYTPAEHARALAEFDETASALIQVKMTDAAFECALGWLAQPSCSLRPNDALHVACALEHEVAAIATFDHRFAAGVAKLKLKGLKLIVLPDAHSRSASKRTPKAEQSRAAYSITTKDIAAAAKWGRIRKNEERLGGLKARRGRGA